MTHSSSLILHNSLANERREVVCIVVTSNRVQVKHANTKPKQQIQPKINLRDGDFSVESGLHELCFEAQLPPLGFGRYELVETDGSEQMVKIETSANFDKT
jgi:hypothetical protein